MIYRALFVGGTALLTLSYVILIHRLRGELNPLQDASGGKKISINDLVIKVIADSPFWFGNLCALRFVDIGFVHFLLFVHIVY
jgi:hypothetical protein